MQRMLFMVIETFRAGNPDAVGARFRARGRLFPDGAGLEYIASWMSTRGDRCYQIMQAPTRAALDGWIDQWSDLVEFEVIEIQTSAQFWSGR